MHKFLSFWRTDIAFCAAQIYTRKPSIPQDTSQRLYGIFNYDLKWVPTRYFANILQVFVVNDDQNISWGPI